MTPKNLRSLGRKRFGDRWQSALAKAMPCASRTVRRWDSGESSIRPMVEARIRQVCEMGIEK